eukprot:3262972-Pyramimonas_sp.AAC.1
MRLRPDYVMRRRPLPAVGPCQEEHPCRTSSASTSQGGQTVCILQAPDLASTASVAEGTQLLDVMCGLNSGTCTVHQRVLLSAVGLRSGYAQRAHPHTANRWMQEARVHSESPPTYCQQVDARGEGTFG